MLDESAKPTPPYIAFATFMNAVKRLVNGDGHKPETIDASLLGTMSGSGQKQFLAALKYFKLIDEQGQPRNDLWVLAGPNENDQKDVLKRLVQANYPDQIELLQTGTPKQLRDSFGNALSGKTLEAAVRFLLQACESAGIKVAQHHDKAKGTSRSTASGAPKPRKRRPASPRSNAGGSSGGDETNDFKSKLLAKFPAFNPEWSPEQQAAWFSAYEKLLKLTSSESSPDD